MEWIETKIDLPKGLHMRPLQVLQERASCCKAEMRILLGGREYNAKSILDMIEMVASSSCGKAVLRSKGDDAEEGLAILLECLRSRKKVGGRSPAVDHRPKSTP